MTRLVVVTFAAVGLILLLTFVATRLVGSRARGLSIRMQVFLALAVIVGAFSFGLGLLVVDRVEARAQRLAQAAAADEANALAILIGSELERTGATLEDVASQLDRGDAPGAARQPGMSGPTGFELLDTDGAVLHPMRGRTQADEPGAVFVDAPLDRFGTRVGTVRVVKPTIVVEAMLADFAPTVLVITLVLTCAAALAAAFIGGTIAAPIERLIEFAERVSRGERQVLPSRLAGREVTRLVESIDLMQRKLEGRPFVETFAADLSHELKNPVAAIRASAELLDESALDDPEHARRFVVRIREATARIEKLLGELLDLARIETRGAEGRAWVDLERVCERVLEPIEARERIRVVVAPGDYRVRGEETWLGRALANLIDNALVHSPPDSPVRLELRSEGGSILVETENGGTLPPHVRSQLFRRFVTTRREKGGTGLGLAIAQAVAEAHGGRIELKQPGSERVVFELRLPRR